MSFSGSLRHPVGLSLMTLFLAAAPSLFLRTLPTPSLLQSLIVLGASIFFMLFIPAAIIRLIYGSPISTFGLALPRDLREAAKLMLIALLALIPIAILLSTQGAFRTYYSRYDISIPSFLIDAGLFALLYYIAEGFLFFGFLFFGLWPRLRYHSFWIVSTLFSLLHFAKPPLEILLSFFSALLFCHLSLKTKSIFPAALVHFIIAFILNVLVTFWS